MKSGEGEERQGETSQDAPATPTGQRADGDQAGKDQGSGDTTVTSTVPYKPKRSEGQRDKQQRQAAGKRSRTRTSRKEGRYITSRRVKHVTDLALDATLREAAPYQRQRREEAAELNGKPRRVLLKRGDMRQKVRVRKTCNAVCFVVDASWR